MELVDHDLRVLESRGVFYGSWIYIYTSTDAPNGLGTEHLALSTFSCTFQLHEHDWFVFESSRGEAGRLVSLVLCLARSHMAPEKNIFLTPIRKLLVPEALKGPP